MSIEQDLRARLTAALKAKDLKTANVIRMVNTKVMEKRTAKGFSGEVDDALFLDVIAAYKKSLDKAKDQFAAAGERGAEQLAELEFETEFLAQFLPEMLGEDQVREIVKKAIADLGASGPKMIGRVMGAVMKEHKGVVEAPLVKKIAAEELGG
jgi:hypothetical protein